MRGSWKLAGVALTGGTAMVLAACAVGAPTPVAAGPSPLLPVAGVVASATDPAGWAAAASARCGTVAAERRAACFEEVLLAVLETGGIRASMETLERLPPAEIDLAFHGHLFAHHIGIAGYRGAEQVGPAFAECTASFQSGCYHGVIQAYFADPRVPAVDAAALDGLCAPYRGEAGNRWLLFQCVHGMGHGLVALHDAHLPRALEGCDLLTDEWEREGCYGGAFMENVVGATMPHHAPRADHDDHGGATHPQHGEPAHDPHAERPHGGHPAGGHHAGHSHAAGAAAEHAHRPAAGAFVPLDPADPHHPCSSLGERYQYACYSMQTSAVLFHAEGDVAAGIALCTTAPERVRGICFTSLGRDINAHANQVHTETIAACMQVPEAFRPHCLVGVAKNLIDLSAEPGDGVAFCRALSSGWGRERCFQAVGEQVAMLESARERRAGVCRVLDDADARACRFGAGVPDPAGGPASPAH